MSIRKTLVALAIISTLSIPFAFAQKTSPKRKTRSQAKPAASPTTPTSSRTRRVAPVTENAESKTETTKPETAASDATAEPSPVSSPLATASPAPATGNTDSKPEETPDKPAETATPSDPIMALRDQIDAAPTPQDRIRLQLKLAEQLAEDGKKTEALAELHAIAGLDVFDPQGFYNTGNALARLGDTDESVYAYRKAIEQRKGRYSRALNNLGVVLLRVGRWDEAHEAFLSALRMESFRYAEASYNLGRLYAKRGQNDLAVREWRRAVAVDPEHSAAKQSLARSGIEGRITVEKPPITSRDTSSRVAPSNTGGSEPPRPKSSAPRDSSKPLTLGPASFGFLQRARTASERGNNTEAIENYQRVIARENGYFGPANLELSYLLIGLKRNDEALPTLLAVATREGSRYPISYYHLARIYEGRGELRLAEDAFTNALAAYGNQNSQFLLDLSRIREKQGNFKGALEAMEQYVALVKKDGQDIAWSEERLAVLRQKASVPK